MLDYADRNTAQLWPERHSVTAARTRCEANKNGVVTSEPRNLDVQAIVLREG